MMIIIQQRLDINQDHNNNKTNLPYFVQQINAHLGLKMEKAPIVFFVLFKDRGDVTSQAPGP